MILIFVIATMGDTVMHLSILRGWNQHKNDC